MTATERRDAEENWVEDDDDAQVASSLAIQRPLIERFANTAAEDWVAEDESGQIIGWSQSVERDGLLYLTMFFVASAHD